jgi:hypothetical protein
MRWRGRFTVIGFAIWIIHRSVEAAYDARNPGQLVIAWLG